MIHYVKGYSMIRKLLGAFCLLISVAAHGWVITNKTGQRVKINAHYYGYIKGFSCRPDSFHLKPRQTKSIDAGGCILRVLNSDSGAAALQNPTGGKYRVTLSNGVYRIEEGQ